MTNEVNKMAEIEATNKAAIDGAVKALASWKETTTVLLGTITVPWDKWAAIPDHPAQRKTSVHAAKITLAGILNKPLASHLKVAAVAVGDLDEKKRLFAIDPFAFLEMPGVTKLDGHTRTFAQRESRAPKPDNVVVDVYAATNKAESTLLYQTFDNPAAGKLQKDTIQSVLNLANIHPTSALFQQGKTGNAMKVATAIVYEGTTAVRPVRGKKTDPSEIDTIEKAMEAIMPHLVFAKAWKREIETLDSLDLDQNVMVINANALAAYLVILRHDPVRGEEFISAIRRGEGVFDSQVADGIYIARTADDHLRLRKGTKLKGKERAERTISIILNAYKGWLVDDKFDAGKYPTGTGVISSLFEEDRKAAARAARLSVNMADVEADAPRAAV